MERETKKITTPSGIDVEMKTYITGGESREISNVYLEGVSVSVDENGKTNSPVINAAQSSKAQDKSIEILVVSVGGKKENVLSEVLNLRNEDFKAVVDELDAIQNGLEKKTK